MPVEGVEDRRHVRRAVVQVAVVVVGGQPLHVAVGGAAAGRGAAAGAGVPGADVAAALVEELVGDDEGGLAVEVERARRCRSRATRSHAAWRVGAAAQCTCRPHGPVPVMQERADVAERGVRRVRDVLQVVGVAHARAVGVAVRRALLRLVGVEAGAVGRHAAAVVDGLEEAVADAGGLQAVDARDVGVALAGVGQRAGGVVVVHAVAPLVVEHGGDLAGVPAAAAGPVEVDRRRRSRRRCRSG